MIKKYVGNVNPIYLEKATNKEKGKDQRPKWIPGISTNFICVANVS